MTFKGGRWHQSGQPWRAPAAGLLVGLLCVSGASTRGQSRPAPPPQTFERVMATPQPGVRLIALAASFPDRTDAILTTIDAFEATLAARTAQTRIALARLTFEDVIKTVRTPAVVERAVSILSSAIDGFTLESLTAELRESAARANRPPQSRELLGAEYNRSRHPAVQLLGELYLMLGNDAAADRAARDVLSGDPAASRANVLAGRVAARAGRDRDALTHYLVASLAAPLAPELDAAMRTLLTRLHGAAADLESARDGAYREKLRTPVTLEPYAPPPGRTSRVALLELFTGSGCGPCIAADLAFEALLARYPDDTIAPIVFHEHIPQPDPMTMTGGNVRFTGYALKGVPDFRVDGAVARHGAGPREVTQTVYESYVAAVDRALQAPSAATIDVRAVVQDGSVQVTAQAAAVRPGVKNPRLVLVLVEQELRFAGENGIRFHPMVARAISTHPMSRDPLTVEHRFDLAAVRADVTASLAAELAKRRKVPSSARSLAYRAEGHVVAIDPDALLVVAFVQDGGGQILQAARAAALRRFP